MHILLTGSNGYIGTRLLMRLVEQGNHVTAMARHPEHVHLPEKYAQQITVMSGDLLDPDSLVALPQKIDAAYYLVHSMASRQKDFDSLDKKAAQNFVTWLDRSTCQQTIYLSGLIVNEHKLSPHLRSRLAVEHILRSAKAPLTTLRSGIIIGAGSASFEIIRDLVEKLPIMVAPKWIKSKCQPIAISDVLFYLTGVLGQKACLGRTFDIGGPDQLSYREMLRGYAKQRRLTRPIVTLPVLTPRLSSYWLIMITSTNYYLARALIDSVKHDAICRDDRIHMILPHTCLSYRAALDQTLAHIAHDSVPSTWKESWVSGGYLSPQAQDFEIPMHGCLSMTTRINFERNPDAVFAKILQLGGRKGWCFMNWAWRIRGVLDRAAGGGGLKKGRRSQADLKSGDVIDCWRVLHLDRENHTLTLWGEMKLQGDAWLKFTMIPQNAGYQLQQHAIFRPRGVWGRIYWYLFYPVHLIMFPGMLKRLVQG